MPRFAQIAVAVPCPSCGRDLAVGGRIAFQWGYCSIPMFADGEAGDVYEVEDKLMWGVDADGRVPAWTYFQNNAGNMGDPRYGDLLVREWEIDVRQCPRCGRALAGIYVVLAAGRIVDVRVYESEPPPAEVCAVGPDGEWTPHPEWGDHPMPIVDWSPRRFVLHRDPKA